MKRRWIIRSLFVMPLLLYLAGWGWSYSHIEGVAYRSKSNGWLHETAIRGGKCLLLGAEKPEDEPFGWQIDRAEYSSELDVFNTNGFRFLGFRFYSNENPEDFGHGWVLEIPFWFLTLCSSATLYLIWRKSRPKPPGFPIENAGPQKSPLTIK